MKEIDHYECGYDLPCPYGDIGCEDIDCSGCNMAVPVYEDGTYGSVGE